MGSAMQVSVGAREPGGSRRMARGEPWLTTRRDDASDWSENEGELASNLVVRRSTCDVADLSEYSGLPPPSEAASPLTKGDKGMSSAAGVDGDDLDAPWWRGGVRDGRWADRCE